MHQMLNVIFLTKLEIIPIPLLSANNRSYVQCAAPLQRLFYNQEQHLKTSHRSLRCNLVKARASNQKELFLTKVEILLFPRRSAKQKHPSAMEGAARCRLRARPFWDTF